MTKGSTNNDFDAQAPHRVLLVDDEPLARQRLLRLISKLEQYKVVAETGDGESALQMIQQYEPDIVLLDINMPVMDGLNCAEVIAQLENPPAVIFCTAYDEYALQAFDADASGYLIKPIEQDKLEAVLIKAGRTNKLQRQNTPSETKQNKDERQYISAKSRRGIELIPLDDVHCFVADQKYVTVYHSEGETLIDETLKDLEQEFDTRFVRIHRNSLVAIDKIEALEKNAQGQSCLRLKSMELSPIVSRRHLQQVKSLLSTI